MDPTTLRMTAMLQAFLRLIGQPELVSGLTHEQWGGEGEWTIMIGKTGIGVDCGHLVEVSGLGRRVELLGFRTVTWRTSRGSRWRPPEVEDVTEVEAQDPSTILLSVAHLLAKDALNRMPDLACGAVVEEQA